MLWPWNLTQLWNNISWTYLCKKKFFQLVLFCWRQRFHRTYRPIGLRHKLLKWEYIFTGMCYDFENLHGDCPNYILCIQIKIYPKWRKYVMTSAFFAKFLKWWRHQRNPPLWKNKIFSLKNFLPAITLWSIIAISVIYEE